MARRPPAGTPALVALQRAGVAHTIHAYEHDPAAESYGLEAAQALDLDPACVFKTLLAEVDGAPTDKRSVVAPKYRDAATGMTWTGRGKQPKWLAAYIKAGKKLADFAI
jgi:DNA-binding protein H-NS